MRMLNVQLKSETVTTSATSASTVMGNQPQSPWHSPVPYLFGGLAAMLGLIALALLILACSYWRLSSSSADGDQVDDDQKESRSGNKAADEPYEDKFLVIMAGDDLPRFLATPAIKRCTCGHEGKMVISQEESVIGADEENMKEEKVKESGETTTSH